MFDGQPIDIQDELGRLTRRLDSYTGAIVLRVEGRSIYSIISANDALLVCQALNGPMNRSSRRKLRNRLFDQVSFVEVSEGFSKSVEHQPRDDKSSPFVCCLLGDENVKKYAILDAEKLKYLEYYLYVSQSSFRDKIYRWY